jgi:hypothetical protein
LDLIILARDGFQLRVLAKAAIRIFQRIYLLISLTILFVSDYVLPSVRVISEWFTGKSLVLPNLRLSSVGEEETHEEPQAGEWIFISMKHEYYPLHRELGSQEGLYSKEPISL